MYLFNFVVACYGHQILLTNDNAILKSLPFLSVPVSVQIPHLKGSFVGFPYPKNVVTRKSILCDAQPPTVAYSQGCDLRRVAICTFRSNDVSRNWTLNRLRTAWLVRAERETVVP